MKAHRLPFSMIAFAFLLLYGCSEPAPPGGPDFTATQPDLWGAPRTLTNAWADFDSDGDPDLFVGFNGEPNRLYRNDGGVLVNIAPEAGIADARGTRTSAWGDFDSDGDPDLLLGFVAGEEPVTRLYRNDGGVFVDVAAEVGLQLREGATRQASWVDFDADGDLDLVVANMNGDANGLFKEQEEGGWRNVASELGLAVDARYDACAFADFDHDGRVDLFVNGTVTGGTQYRDYLFGNTPEGFVDLTPEALLTLDADHGVQWVDFDADGDVDLSLTGATDSGMHHLLSNQVPQTLEARSILVQVTDGNGFRTRAGAEVRVYEAGTRTLLGTRLLDTGSGYNTQSSLPVHFGLPRKGLVDIEVIFPGGGSRSVTAVKNVDPRDYTGRPVTVTLSE